MPPPRSVTAPSTPRQTLVKVPPMARPASPSFLVSKTRTLQMCLIMTPLLCPSVRHSLQMPEKTGFPWLCAQLACCPDCFVSGIFINSTHTVSDRITAGFVDRGLLTGPSGLQISNAWCSYQTWHLFFIPHHWFSTHQPTYFIEKTVSPICRVLIAVTLKSLPENLQP